MFFLNSFFMILDNKVLINFFINFSYKLYYYKFFYFIFLIIIKFQFLIYNIFMHLLFF